MSGLRPDDLPGVSVPERALEHPQIRVLLERFIDRLDKYGGFEHRHKRLLEPLDNPVLTDLSQPTRTGDDDVLWTLIQELAEAGVVSIAYKRRPRTDDPPWRHASLSFQPRAEAPIRAALGRVITPTFRANWQEAVRQLADHFAMPEFVEALPVQVYGLEPREVLTRLIQVPRLLEQRPMSLYQLSALLFHGDSKALRDREGWLQMAFGLDEEALVRRPVLIEAWMPNEIKGVLLIENLDSYLEASNGGWPGVECFVLIYTAGFRGAASRTRDPRHARFHWSDSGSMDDRCRRFAEDWCREGPLSIPAYFCGDLDWAGFDMFNALNDVIPGLIPWEPGYNAMIHAQRLGMGHTPEQAGKLEQRDPKASSSPFIQSIIRSMERDPRFVDQEVVGAMLAGIHPAEKSAGPEDG